MLTPDQSIEFSFWEAGCLIWVGAKDLGKLSYSEFCHLIWGDNLEQSRDYIVNRKVFIPLNLYQDDGYSVRVKMSDLTTQEAEEWVARARWQLDLSCGQMVISGIADDEEDAFLEMPSAINTEATNNAFQCYVDVPPGIYQVEIYSYPPGDLSTGWGQITNPKLFRPTADIEPEPLADYFLRTRSAEEAPPWIALELTDDPEQKQKFYDQLGENSYIDFIVRITPELEDLPCPMLEKDGCVTWEFRKPNRCPLGIVSSQK